MQSGAPTPVGDMSNGQADYDQLVANAGCSSASDSLECLRGVSLSTLQAAVDKSPGIFSHRVCIPSPLL